MFFDAGGEVVGQARVDLIRTAAALQAIDIEVPVHGLPAVVGERGSVSSPPQPRQGSVGSGGQPSCLALLAAKAGGG